jgi:hypothetical protein
MKTKKATKSQNGVTLTVRGVRFRHAVWHRDRYVVTKAQAEHTGEAFYEVWYLAGTGKARRVLVSQHSTLGNALRRAREE